MATPRLFCFGLGYSALALVEDRLAAGWRIAGTCRTPEKAALLAERGIDAVVWTGEGPLDDGAARLAGTTHLLISVAPGPGPDEAADPVLDHNRDILAAIGGLQWVGYLSATSVYGDHGGAVVDETAALLATSTHGRRRIGAEQAWLDFGRETGVPVQVFRLSGIYGPGRSAIDQVRRGTARRVDRPDRLFSRIHVADIARVLAASIARPEAAAIYNVGDDRPAPSADVVAHACRLLGVEPPPLIPFEEAGLSPMARDFYADHKILDTARLKRDLGVTLAYPDYESGLAAILAAGDGAGS